jgi:hypothetical protein
MTALTLNINSIIKLTREQFYQICEENPDLKLERNAQGELLIMPPTGGETGRSNGSTHFWQIAYQARSLGLYKQSPPSWAEKILAHEGGLCSCSNTLLGYFFQKWMLPK